MSLSDQRTTVTVDAELNVPAATVQIARFCVEQPQDGWLGGVDGYRLDLSVTPRIPNARVSFHNHWAAHRFERPGKVFIVPPGEVLHCKSDGGRQTSIVCMLGADIFERWSDQEFEHTNQRLEASLDIPRDNIQRLMVKLGEEARHPGFAAQALGEAMAVQLAIELVRFYRDAPAHGATGGLQPWRLRMIEERLREVRQQPTLSELATLCGLSVRQLSRGFRASRGCSVGEHIARLRVENAQRLLATGESVKSIAYSMGFASPSSFCHAFRKATGRPPHQSRRLAQGA